MKKNTFKMIGWDIEQIMSKIIFVLHKAFAYYLPIDLELLSARLKEII